MTERLHFHFSLSCIGEGNGNPLQCSCLENPRDGGAWWAAVYGVAQSWTRLKQLSSRSRREEAFPTPKPPKWNRKVCVSFISFYFSQILSTAWVILFSSWFSFCTATFSDCPLKLSTPLTLLKSYCLYRPIYSYIPAFCKNFHMVAL